LPDSSNTALPDNDPEKDKAAHITKAKVEIIQSLLRGMNNFMSYRTPSQFKSDATQNKTRSTQKA
jgi:hypothetical protein